MKKILYEEIDEQTIIGFTCPYKNCQFENEYPGEASEEVYCTKCKRWIKVDYGE